MLRLPRSFLIALVTVAIALASCGFDNFIAVRPADLPAGSAATPTPIVVDITVPDRGAGQNAPRRPIIATAAPPRHSPTTSKPDLPAPSPTIVLTFTPQAAVTQSIVLTPLPTDATTGLTATETFTDTAVPEPVEPITLPQGTVNVALLGVDTRPGKGYANTDVIVVASINPDVPAVTLLSIPRDTLVYIPGWRSAKVNTAFSHGGPDLFKQTIKYNFGLNLDYFAMVDFSTVITAVDTLDGVDVIATCPLMQVFPKDPYYVGDETSPLTVTQPYTDTFTGEVWQPGSPVPTHTIEITRPGVLHLDGLEALAFVRARYGVPGGDIDRGRREQRLIRAMFLKAKQIDAIPRIPQLYDRLKDNIKTDLTLENILYFAGMAGRFGDALIRSRYIDPGGLKQQTFPEIGSVLQYDRAKMRDFIAQALTVALNQRPNDGIPIEVWNGTADRDFGIVAADRLAELGFVVKEIKAADHFYPRTSIVDYTTTEKGSAIPMLLRTFKLQSDQVTQQPTRDGPRYRIIVGPDFNPCYFQNGDLAPVEH